MDTIAIVTIRPSGPINNSFSTLDVDRGLIAKAATDFEGKPVTQGFGGNTIGHLTNVRVMEDGSCVADIVFNKSDAQPIITACTSTLGQSPTAAPIISAATPSDPQP